MPPNADDRAIPAYTPSGEAHAIAEMRTVRFFAAIDAQNLGCERERRVKEALPGGTRQRPGPETKVAPSKRRLNERRTMSSKLAQSTAASGVPCILVPPFPQNQLGMRDFTATPS